MKLSEHIATTPLLIALMLIFKRSAWEVVIAVLANIFVDIDHLIDYFQEYNFRKLNIKHFFQACYKHWFKKYYLLAHSYELAFALIIIGLLFSSPIFAIGIGILYHLVWDHLYNGCYFSTYFLIFRFKNNFESKNLFKFDKHDKF